MLVDITHPMMRPARDPLRSLIYAAGDRAVRAVYVDGHKVVENGEVLTMDYRAAPALWLSLAAAISLTAAFVLPFVQSASQGKARAGAVAG